jgi:hypothetical protein
MRESQLEDVAIVREDLQGDGLEEVAALVHLADVLVARPGSLVHRIQPLLMDGCCCCTSR